MENWSFKTVGTGSLTLGFPGMGLNWVRSQGLSLVAKPVSAMPQTGAKELLLLWELQNQ